MKRNIVMKINCVECGKRYCIADDELDDYNIYWVMTDGKLGMVPKLLCPVCTKKWSKKVI